MAGDVTEAEALAVLDAAVQAGVTLIDTADVYGDGRSEQRIGEFLRANPGSDLFVATKMGRRAPLAADHYTLQNFRLWTDRSRRNLGVERLDLVQLHCPPTEVYSSPQVYDAYFARCPESRKLMLMTDEHMRGRMLESVILLLMVGSAEEQRDYIRFETKSHLSYGVLPHMYENVLTAVRDTVRGALGSDWTIEIDAAWSERLDAILHEIHAVA
jgi:hemoglobin-like flavoprotein